MLDDHDLKTLVELRLEADGATTTIQSLVQDIRGEGWLDLKTAVNCAIYGLRLFSKDTNSELSVIASNLIDRWNNRYKE